MVRVNESHLNQFSHNKIFFRNEVHITDIKIWYNNFYDNRLRLFYGKDPIKENGPGTMMFLTFRIM